MPRRTDLRKILVIGSGPIVIGQACEFDYSGSQACKALREEGYEIVLVNSNPATIMTDPGMADRTYIEPLTAEFVRRIMGRERPDALLPTVGGQTGLNLAVFLAREGVLDELGVEVIGVRAEAIARAEDRALFKRAMEEIGCAVPPSGVARGVAEALEIAGEIGYPVILRPAFTLGGTGGATAYDAEELAECARRALEASPVGQALVEQSVLGWKEIEFEVMRDCRDQVIIVTSMENVDPMGVHTGDSMVVAPAQTLSAAEYAGLTALCRRIVRKIDVTGGGANIQFAVNPDDGRVVVIEVNPRLSRSSALASKATGFPIARVSAKLAVGLTLEEIQNDITGCTSCFFEPVVDYCVFKIARFAFEKYPQAEPTLNTSMKSVGEAMSLGRNFKEAFQKGLRSLETGRFGWGADGKDLPAAARSPELIREKLRLPNDQRVYFVRHALEEGMSIEEICALSGVDRWFLENMREILEMERELRRYRRGGNEELAVPPEALRRAKEMGFADRQLAFILNSAEEEVRAYRRRCGVEAVFKPVDTCAGVYPCRRPYYYSTYELRDESRVGDRPRVVILGGGPNRIGQGIEFDYCCVHASYALRAEGYESVMINSNPETVSTDYDSSDRLYFEPLTREDVLNVIERENPVGVIVQFGGQTPLDLAVPLERAGVPILGTSPDSIDRAEDRERFNTLLWKLGLVKPANGTATSVEGARRIAAEVGYPVLVRPSYVLGGRAMHIVYDDEELDACMEGAVRASADHPVLVERFLEEAIEVDVDAVADGEDVLIGGIMEHIEEAGIHSGDSACVLPPHTLTEEIVDRIREQTRALARELQVRGLINVQYAVKNDTVYVLEVNPRASRTVPFVSKATGLPLAGIALRLMLGRKLKELGVPAEVSLDHVAVKEAVFPFQRFPGVDVLLGPEMKSTGEVMGIDRTFGLAFAKAQIAAGQKLPARGRVFISVRNQDKRAVIFIAKKLADLGFRLVATRGTAHALRQNDLEVEAVRKLHEGRPHVLDLLQRGAIDLVINTPGGKLTRRDEALIRSYAVARGVPVITTVAGASAVANALESLRRREPEVKTIQEYHGRWS